jgi:hypothetical protein
VLLNIGLVYDELDEGVLFLLTFQDISEFKEPINPSCEYLSIALSVRDQVILEKIAFSLGAQPVPAHNLSIFVAKHVPET